MAASAPTLVCFAVKEESRPFQQLIRANDQVQVLLTGMGRRNAAKAITSALARGRYGLVVSAGFAGGLDPALASATVLFACEDALPVRSALLKAEARPARFHCADRVATTAAEKRALREQTGADAVEMESAAICATCTAQAVPSAIIRVVLDTADEDLPLDFNQLMTADDRISYPKLAASLMANPGKIAALTRFRKQSHACASRLASILVRTLS